MGAVSPAIPRLVRGTTGSTAQPYDGLVEVLKAAHSAGKKWGVVTNKFRRFAEPLMNEMPFEPSAGVLVTPCDVTHAKPHPEPVLLARLS